MSEELMTAKKAIIAAANLLKQSGMLFYGEHANLSARLGNDKVVRTRGGHIGNLSMDDFAVLDLEGKVLEGGTEAVGAEVIAMHTRIYQARANIGAVIHCHPPHVTAFAVAHR